MGSTFFFSKEVEQIEWCHSAVSLFFLLAWNFTGKKGEENFETLKHGPKAQGPWQAIVSSRWAENNGGLPRRSRNWLKARWCVNRRCRPVGREPPADPRSSASDWFRSAVFQFIYSGPSGMYVRWPSKQIRCSPANKLYRPFEATRRRGGRSATIPQSCLLVSVSVSFSFFFPFFSFSLARYSYFYFIYIF